MNVADLTPEQLEQLATAIFSPNKPLNFGPFILGSLIDAVLFGVLLMQCGSYLSLSARDGWLLKSTVACVMIVNLWSTAFAWAWVWDFFVRNFGIYRAFFSTKYTSWTTVIIAGNGVAVQMFFALRAWKMLDRNRLFGAVLVVLMLAFVGSSLAIKILYTRYPSSLYIEKDKMRAPMYLCTCSLVAGDVLITTTILWYILSRPGGTRRANHLLKQLARVTFESQLPPTIVAVAIVGVLAVRPESFILMPLVWGHAKLYGISLLHTLNVRSELAQPTVIFGTTYTAPGWTTGTGGLQFAARTARTAQTGESNVIRRSDAVGVSQSRSYFSTPNEPPKPTVNSFDEESVATTSGGTLKVDILPVISHSGSSEVEMVESKSRLPDLESHMTTAG